MKSDYLYNYFNYTAIYFKNSYLKNYFVNIDLKFIFPFIFY